MAAKREHFQRILEGLSDGMKDTGSCNSVGIPDLVPDLVPQNVRAIVDMDGEVYEVTVTHAGLASGELEGFLADAAFPGANVKRL